MTCTCFENVLIAHTYCSVFVLVCCSVLNVYPPQTNHHSKVPVPCGRYSLHLETTTDKPIQCHMNLFAVQTARASDPSGLLTETETQTVAGTTAGDRDATDSRTRREQRR